MALYKYVYYYYYNYYYYVTPPQEDRATARGLGNTHGKFDDIWICGSGGQTDIQTRSSQYSDPIPGAEL